MGKGISLYVARISLSPSRLSQEEQVPLMIDGVVLNIQIHPSVRIIGLDDIPGLILCQQFNVFAFLLCDCVPMILSCLDTMTNFVPVESFQTNFDPIKRC